MRAGLVLALLGAGCASGDGSRSTAAWDPSDGGTSDDGESDLGTAESTAGDSGGEGEGGETPGVCNPGVERQCLCDDGQHLGVEACNATGESWDPCICDDVGGEETGGDVAPTEVCYLGEDESGTVCLGLHYLQPEGYDYPPALDGDPNYRRPIAYLDLQTVDPDTMLAPNFALGELAQLSRGRYAIVQPHAVESLQALRDAVGGIVVNSGYRSPEYNASVDGVAYSRHMYGDGFDLAPTAVPLSTLEATCTSQGGMLVEYMTHVHCDFRYVDVAVEFFGQPGAPAEPEPPGFSATVQDQGARTFTAPAQGFEEGEPVRRWFAYDASDELIDAAIGPVYVAPAEAARVRVRVGAQVELEISP